MAFVGPKIFEQMGRAKSSEAKIRIQQLAGQIEMYKLEVGKYPEQPRRRWCKQPGGRREQVERARTRRKPDLKDAWGNDYRYTIPGQGKAFDLVSLGADGKEGGEGENRDVSN